MIAIKINNTIIKIIRRKEKNKPEWGVAPNKEVRPGNLRPIKLDSLTFLIMCQCIDLLYAAPGILAIDLLIVDAWLMDEEDV